MKTYCLIFLTCLFLSLPAEAQSFLRLDLPNREQLTSERVLSVIQDSEGCLWYATEGGGICRDDGWQMSVFRNDADHPDLLGSNNVACQAEIQRHMIIGTFHGAYVLDKHDFSIRRLMEVDDNRVDDILVTRQGEVLLTANKKIYRFDAQFKLLNTYPSRWKGHDAYVAHLFEDRSGRIWATQWNGGLLSYKNGSFVEMPWPLESQPTALADDEKSGGLWIGTVGRGIVRYHTEKGTIEQQPETGNAVCIDLQLSADGKRLWMITMNALSLYQVGTALTVIPVDGFVPEGEMVLHRLSLDLEGRLLVAGSTPGPFVITDKAQSAWYNGVVSDGNVSWEFRERQGLVMRSDGHERVVSAPRQLLSVMARRTEGGIWVTDGQQLYSCVTDSVVPVAQLSSHPVALTDDSRGNVWYSTGQDIRRIKLPTGHEEEVLDLEDVSALAFTKDGTLWMTTIYGKLYQYAKGKLTLDQYANNEHGDAVTDLRIDSLGRLLMVSDRYVRLYDTERHTLRQQSRETAGVYGVELQETAPNSRWSMPILKTDTAGIPKWLTAWWMWCIYVLLLIVPAVMLIRVWQLRQQSKKFMEQIKSLQADKDQTTEQTPAQEQQENTQDAASNLFLSNAIAQVEAHLSDDSYNVEQLSSDLCMSRMTFYRKIQSVTGQKPTEFIRTIRLRRAAEMLREDRMTVSEISCATGFSSVSYFSRCFRSMYNVSPTQFGKNTTTPQQKS